VGGADVAFCFSSRRRHTSSDRDWSSDVCSSDLAGSVPTLTIAIPDSVLSMPAHDPWAHGAVAVPTPGDRPDSGLAPDLVSNDDRSEERRVGKEGRPRWRPEPERGSNEERTERRR